MALTDRIHAGAVLPAAALVLALSAGASAAERTVECYREVIEERRRTLHTDRPRTWAQVPAADSDEATATDDTTGIAARTGSQPLETC